MYIYLVYLKLRYLSIVIYLSIYFYHLFFAVSFITLRKNLLEAILLHLMRYCPTSELEREGIYGKTDVRIDR